MIGEQNRFGDLNVNLILLEHELQIWGDARAFVAGSFFWLFGDLRGRKARAWRVLEIFGQPIAQRCAQMYSPRIFLGPRLF